MVNYRRRWDQRSYKSAIYSELYRSNISPSMIPTQGYTHGPIMIPPFMPPPPLPFPIPQFTPAAIDHSVGVDYLKETSPSSEGESEVDDLSITLPFYEEEVANIDTNNITDILIIDLDRTLLSTPSLNRNLFTKQALQVLENKLEWGHTWLQSPEVLEATINIGRWNDDLVELARLASLNTEVILVLTTTRDTGAIPRIMEALSSQGIDKVDHWSCSTKSHITDARSKGKLLEVLLESYPSLERLSVADGNHFDANIYRNTASNFVHEGWLNAEAILIMDLTLQLHQLHPSTERELVKKALAASSLRFKGRIFNDGMAHYLSKASRLALLKALTGQLSEELFTNWFQTPVLEVTPPTITPDTLSIPSMDPEALRNLWSPGSIHHWVVDRLRIHDRVLKIDLHLVSGSLNWTQQRGMLAIGKVYNADKNQDLQLDFKEVLTTLVYERRQLDLTPDDA